MEVLTGTVTSVTGGSQDGKLTDDFSQNEVSFINPKIPDIKIGDTVDYLKIIQSTPNGDTVINIIKAKRPR